MLYSGKTHTNLILKSNQSLLFDKYDIVLQEWWTSVDYNARISHPGKVIKSLYLQVLCWCLNIEIRCNSLS